jgi:protein tyrosine phosphatase
MVLNEGCSLIVMLTKVQENGNEKCTQYWPLEGIMTDANGIIIENKNKQGIKGDSLVLTTLLVTDKKGVVHEIKHLHCLCFPDHDTIEEEDYSIIDEIVNTIDENRIKNPTGKVVMHCSAGIGRTGTIISIYNIKYALDEATKMPGVVPRISVFGTVRRIREQRMGSVQTTDQYYLIYSYFAYRIKKGLN